MIEITSGLILVDQYEVVEDFKDLNKVLNSKLKFTIKERFKSEGIYIKFVDEPRLAVDSWLMYRTRMRTYSIHLQNRVYSESIWKLEHGQH